MKPFLALALLLTASPLASQQSPTTLTASLQQVLTRESNGHSPTEEDINSTQTLKPTPEDVQASLPILTRVLASPDAPARTFALSALAGLETAATPPTEPQAADAPPVPTGPATFPAAIAEALTPAIPIIAAHLTDDLPANRALTVTILGGFIPNPPPAVYPPLLAFLKREDAASATGGAVVADLLQFGPLTPPVVEAVAKFLRRSDQDANTRANLVDAIGTSPNQSQALNKSMLAFLDADDPSLRARVILSLPQLDLAPDVFAETRTRIAQLAENSGENLQVVNAAKAVAPCWTAPKMSSGCPTY